MNRPQEAAQLLEEWIYRNRPQKLGWREGQPEQHTPDYLVGRTRAWRERMGRQDG